MKVNSAVIVISFVILLISFWNRNDLPEAFDAVSELRDEPRQTATRAGAFYATYNNVDYRVEPEYEYDLHGLVVSFRHHLASYSSEAGGKRGTSTTRTDTGDGACETVFVEKFEIIKAGRSAWRQSMWASLLRSATGLAKRTGTKDNSVHWMNSGTRRDHGFF